MVGETRITLSGPSVVLPDTDYLYTGVLEGVDDDGLWKPMPNRTVLIRADGADTARAVTDSTGRFEVTLRFNAPCTLVARYNAAGTRGTPPPSAPLSSDDIVNRVCSAGNERTPYTASGTAWSPTPSFTPCGDESTSTEPAYCWPNTRWITYCPPGADAVYREVMRCTNDSWKETTQTCYYDMCWAVWQMVDEDLYYPVGHTSYGTYYPSGITPPRPTPVDLGFYESTYVTPAASNIRSITKPSTSQCYVAYKEQVLPGFAPNRYWISRLRGRVANWPIASTYSCVPEGIAVTSTGYWVVENDGNTISLAEVDVVSGTATRTVLTNYSAARYGDFIGLSDGGLAYAWYDFDYALQNTGRFGVAYISPDGIIYKIYPIDVTQTGYIPSTRMAMAEHPGDGSIWVCYHRDSEHTLGAIRVIPTPDGVTLAYADANFVGRNDPLRIYGETPAISLWPDYNDLTLVAAYTAFDEVDTCVRGQNPDGTPTRASKWQSLAIMKFNQNGQRTLTAKTGKTHHYLSPNNFFVLDNGKQRFIGCNQQPFKSTRTMYLFGPDSEGWQSWTRPIALGDAPASSQTVGFSRDTMVQAIGTNIRVVQPY